MRQTYLDDVASSESIIDVEKRGSEEYPLDLGFTYFECRFVAYLLHAMNTDRRFNEREIADIFERAAREQERVYKKRPANEGLSLVELQRIGAESGIEPEFIARAVAAIDYNLDTPELERYLGIPITAAKTIVLERALTEEEWEHLVVDCRSTFDAKGEIEVSGSIRHWANGNLHVFVEPAESGYRLRMETKKSDAQMRLGAGLFNVVFGLLFWGFALSQGIPETVIFVAASLLLLMGVGLMGHTAYKLPRWSKTRGDQMEGIASRLLERMRQKPASSSEEAVDEPVISLEESSVTEERRSKNRQKDRA